MNLRTEETEPTKTLATFLADLRFEKLPRPVIERTKELFLDWIASALAGRDARPVRVLERLAAHMGPREGRARSWSRAVALPRCLLPW